MKKFTKDTDLKSIQNTAITLTREENKITLSLKEELKRNVSELYRFRNLLDKISEGIILIDLETKIILDINSSACSMLSIHKNAVLKKNAFEIFQQLGFPFFELIFENLKINKKTSETYANFQPLNKEKVFLDFTVNIEQLSGIDYAIILIKDVSKAIISENKLRDSRTNLQAAIENNADSIWTVDERFNILTMNTAFKKQFKWLTNIDIDTGSNIIAVFPEPLKSRWVEYFARALKPESFTIEESYTVGSEKRFFEISFNPLIVRNAPRGVAVYARNVTEKKIAERNLIESEYRFRTMIETAPLGTVVTRNGKIIYTNKSFLELFGYPGNSDVKNKFIYDLIHADYRNEFRDQMDKMKIVGDYIACYEVVGIKSDGSEVHLQINANNIHLSDGLVQFAYVTNISQQKEIQKNLEAAKNEAQKSESLKTEFIAQMSHEIRTPINTILSFIGLIKEDIKELIDKDLLDSFRIIDKASKRIIRTIDLILNLSEIQTGTYIPKLRKYHLYNDILLEIISEFHNQAYEKGLELKIENRTSFGELIVDEYTVTQIFANLIDNAIKYSQKGSITVTVNRNDKNQLFVDVNDTGIGMSKKYMQNLFKPFTQEDGGYTRLYQGNGLGLALVKKYCEINNADISAQSKKGIGTKFTVTFLGR